ncbi:hypothetical protein FGO68_gene16984 [Halteria grandinella]|uniref:Uncharacterized protein n=1 Tax=Halteria grandinella TaxID=5974 RepID=A0A8J8P725_HALGN|nr:hypothetical protein FGO68_gene16984 [Halteria grandinella]
MYIAKQLIRKPATSLSMCAASVTMASDPDRYPPMISAIMNVKEMPVTRSNLYMAAFPCCFCLLRNSDCSIAQLPLLSLTSAKLFMSIDFLRSLCFRMGSSVSEPGSESLCSFCSLIFIITPQ